MNCESGAGKKEIAIKHALSRWLLGNSSSIIPGSLRNIQNCPTQKEKARAFSHCPCPNWMRVPWRH